ncbi:MULTISPECIES: hypothetical protein [Bacillus cereus group]|uniref:hypothetical protein n=1 Tax=Bacillus cereus group TaxID=86661 RepID=UPI0029C2C7EC|nr:hypothetical protein [Bacillus cereus group sp. BfR-BA-00999]MDM5373541.1 hypothetical protein [Bacillus bombysepticus]MDX5886405.1 hypothetical protein [Bacillus cereus group sp. BfR-BA-00999]
MAIKPIIDPAATLGETLLLVDVKPAYERIEKENGKFERTEKILNYVYTVVCVERKFEKVSIKIDEPRPLYDEEVPDNTYVGFSGLIINPYVSNGWINLSAKADRCVVIEE